MELGRIVVERGVYWDYRGLAGFHYRGGRPGVPTAVYRAAWARPTVIGRYLKRKGEMQVVGVLVVSRPVLFARARNVALGGRYRDLDRATIAALVNREVRTISRVIVEPRFRGLGLAVRLVRRALKDAETPVTEAFAAMGRVHPFFERAGMTRVDLPRPPEDERVLAAFEATGVTAEFVDEGADRPVIESMGDVERALLRAEVGRYLRKEVGGGIERLANEVGVVRRRVRCRAGYWWWGRE